MAPAQAVENQNLNDVKLASLSIFFIQDGAQDTHRRLFTLGEVGQFLAHF